MKSKFVVLALMALALAACQDEKVGTGYMMPKLDVPSADPVVLHDVQWKVYNADDLRKVASEIEKRGKKGYVLFALTPDGYKALSMNMIEIRRYIAQQKAVTIYLRNVVNNRSVTPDEIQSQKEEQSSGKWFPDEWRLPSMDWPEHP